MPCERNETKTIEIFIGIMAGIVSGLGMGGGTILILLISLFLNIEHHIAQTSNVIFFIPTAISAIIVFIKNKNIKFKIGLPICFFGTIGAIVGANISINMNVDLLRKCFGIFLIFIAINQIYSFIVTYRKEKKWNNNIK